jgi:hypothetical protein
VIIQFDCALDLSIDDQVFATKDLAFYSYRFSDAGGASRGFMFSGS